MTDTEYYSKSPAMEFNVVATFGKARASDMQLPHAMVNTPIFMPVGTQGTIKGLTKEQIERTGATIILGNTYHLGHRPGPEIIDEMGGLHNFMDWDRNLLTDSGGFQMVSLSKLSEVTEEGVLFQSPHDGSELLLKPEMSIHIQNKIGADIIMALDDVVSSITTGPRVEEAMHRTIRWIDRCIEAHEKPHCQNLFAIVQGGLEPDLRKQCAEALIERNTPGYAIGGLSGGESKDKFWRVVSQCTSLLPKNKPRYLMGVGYPVDLVTCVALGVDMFDCVYPTRTARFGTALVSGGLLNTNGKQYEFDFTPLEENCDCFACQSYTRSFFYANTGTELAGQLISIHNIRYLLKYLNTNNSNISASWEN
eukprot:TRINITY_DN3897_c0_g1_i2.p1 TRINITY_DN3897_c0_g1~~TRINITY_DN3897_c0_g1_i2.p1  ORF type:complete len:365 (+),score=67.93 TRINITY_DN3897_c0_g1_i2:281-1375(+)